MIDVSTSCNMVSYGGCMHHSESDLHSMQPTCILDHPHLHTWTIPPCGTEQTALMFGAVHTAVPHLHKLRMLR